MFDWDSFWSCTLGSGKSIWNRRCDAIEYKLNKNNIDCYVHRHTVFGIKCYVVTGRNECTFDSKDLEEILDIPTEWINLSHAGEFREYYILENEFNNLYCDKDGEIVFKEKKSFTTLCNETDDVYEIRRFIEDVMDVSLYHCELDNGLFYLKVENESSFFSRFALAEKLGISYNNVSCYDNSGKWIYVIKIENLKE